LAVCSAALTKSWEHRKIPNSESAEFLRTLLPGGSSVWDSAFTDTTDSMDNSFWYKSSAFLRDSFLLLTTDRRDSAGRVIPDEARALHPPQVAHYEVGDFDFTLITLHLTFADGDTAESMREFRAILDYLDWYFTQPDHDPDVIVCGDFNTPSVLSGQTGRNGITLDEVFDSDPRFQTGERRFAITVHDPTSRSPVASGGGPARNYDHCVVSADAMEEFVQARRVSTNIFTDHPEDPEARLTSDHFPIVAFFKTRGDGISLDLRRRIRP
jgi:endonuclease/exonuclease/phosphatase family metal-dependent hydrolase